MYRSVEVPQTPYISPSRFDRQPSVFFSMQGDPIQGVNLSRAYHGQLDTMNYRDCPHGIMPTTSGRTSLRIMWPGYGEWVFRNITITNLGSSKDVHTMHKLVNSLARKIYDFYTEMTSPSAPAGRNPFWALQNIDFNLLYIKELRHVSQGCWMPVLQYVYWQDEIPMAIQDVQQPYHY